MKKTMLYFKEVVHEQLRTRAFHQRVSVAELVRRAVDEYLVKHPVSKFDREMAAILRAMSKTTRRKGKK